jgi:flotillin
MIANVSPEEANAKRSELAKQVTEQAREDLRQLGLVLDFFKIQEISDEQGYLEAIGRKRNAEVRQEAQIAEATAEAEARIVAAEQKQKGKVAEAEAAITITEAENRLSVHQAELRAKTNEAEERAKVAGRIAKAKEEQELEGFRIERNRKRHEADTVVPAEAEKAAQALLAEGEAARILHNGKATAEAVKLMREQWEDGNTRELFLIHLVPELLNHITRFIADNLHIEKLTVLDSGQGEGLPTYFKGLTGSAVSVLEQLKNATGMDLPDMLQKAAEGSEASPSALPKEKI